MARKKIIIILIIVLLFLSGMFFLLADKAAAPSTKEQDQVGTPAKTGKSFKTFSGKQFEDLYNSFAYPNTQLINEDSPITGDEKVDTRIRKLALAKGYKLRSAPVADTFTVVQKNMVLQQRAARPWLDMKNRAAKEGVKLSLAAAYRSAKDQTTIFLSGLKGISVASIRAGEADRRVNAVLDKTALPGYSRHHTGYTIDIVCDSDPSVKFEHSKCFMWLSKDNYLNAKKSGWIPSYPPGAGKQGPEPEPWEYVWVGTQALK